MLIRFVDADGTLRHVQIDVGKTFRESVLGVYARHGVESIDAVLLTHDHADAVGGLDDLRALQRFDRETRQVLDSTKVLCDARTLAFLKQAFPYLFPRRPAKLAHEAPFSRLNSLDEYLKLERECGLAPPSPAPAPASSAPSAAAPSAAAPSPAPAPAVQRFVARLEWSRFPEDATPFSVEGLVVRALPVMHGSDYRSFGFGFGGVGARVVYLSDYTELLPPTAALLDAWSRKGASGGSATTGAGVGGGAGEAAGEAAGGSGGGSGGGIALLVLDALTRDYKSPVHASLEQSVELARRYRPARTLCVGMGDELEHVATNAWLRELLRGEGLDVQLAHDGLLVPLELRSGGGSDGPHDLGQAGATCVYVK